MKGGDFMFLTANSLGVTSEMLGGVLDEVIALVPIVLPTIIGFIGIRKGISFVKSALQSA